MATFGHAFRATLRSRGLTQAETATLLGTTQSVVSYYSNLERPPRRGTLLNISERLGVSVAELTGEATSTEPKKSSSSRTPAPPNPPLDQAVSNALLDLKARWKRKPNERDTIKHLIAALFPKNPHKITAWLEQ